MKLEQKFKMFSKHAFKRWLTVISGGNPGLINGFPLFQTETRASKQWLAITSDSNPIFKIKEQPSGLVPLKGCHNMDYFIFIHPRVDVRFSASSLAKEEKSSFYRQILYLL